MLYNKDWAYKLNPVADVLFNAADLLEKHGHIKHERGNEHVGMCFLGALDTAQGRARYSGGDTLLTYEAAEAVAQSLGLKLDVQHQESDYRHAMANWNNAGERTGQEVIDAMRSTASKLMENAHAV